MEGLLMVIKEAATSKKFIMALAGVAVTGAGRIGLQLPVEDVALIVMPVVAYIIGQGWADSGKEAAKVEGAVVLAQDGKLSEKAVLGKLD